MWTCQSCFGRESTGAETKSEIVNVLPTLHAGGSGQLAALNIWTTQLKGIYLRSQMISDTAIGMHIKHAQIQYDQFYEN